jgi:flagellar biosynthesis/type III secretory pathway chaperone
MQPVADVERQGAPPEGNVVLELLDRQVSLYRRLRELAGEQHSLISTDEASRLLSVLAERQHLVAELAELDKELKPLRREWPAVRARLTVRQRERAEGMVTEVGRLLREIIDSDRRDGELLTQLAGKKNQEIAALDAGRRANAAYGQFRSDGSRYVDQTDDGA